MFVSISVIKSKKRRGAWTVPCGTPDETGISSDEIRSIIIWLTDFACCDWSIPGPLVAVWTSSSRSPFQNRNNQQSHIINILLALSVRSVRQVMDPCFCLPCFHGPHASHLCHERKEKPRSITCRTDLALG